MSRRGVGGAKSDASTLVPVVSSSGQQPSSIPQQFTFFKTRGIHSEVSPVFSQQPYIPQQFGLTSTGLAYYTLQHAYSA